MAYVQPSQPDDSDLYGVSRGDEIVFEALMTGLDPKEEAGVLELMMRHRAAERESQAGGDAAPRAVL